MRKCIKTTVVILLLLILLSCIFSFFMKWSYTPRMIEYYSDDNNYVTCEVTVKEIFLDENGVLIDIISKNENVENLKYQTRVLVPMQYSILNKNGFLDNITVGSEIEIIIAPRMFGDGYIIPIAGIKVGDIVYLDFDMGKKLILEYVKK